MIPLGLGSPNGPAMRAYLEVLTSNHQPRFDYDLLDLDGRTIGRLPTPFDGQVTIDDDAAVTRVWSGTVLDPDHRLRIDRDAPGAGALYADRMLSITHTVHVPALNRDVSAGVFYGPLTKFDRDGDTAAIECQGLEVLGLVGTRPRTWTKGSRAVTVIREILASRMGQIRFRFPHGVKARLSRAVSVGWSEDAAPWPTARRLAHEIGYQLFMAGDGYAVLRRRPKASSHTFASYTDRGRGLFAQVTSVPKVGYDNSAIRNAVPVKIEKHPFSYVALPPASHPLSPQALKRHGIPLYLATDVIKLKKTTKPKTARKVADDELDRLLRQDVNVTFDAIPTYHHDVGDVVTLQTRDVAMRINLAQATIPTGSGDMAVGYHKLLARPARRARGRSRGRSGSAGGGSSSSASASPWSRPGGGWGG